MRRIIMLLLLACGIDALSQNVERKIVLLDVDNNQPIEEATVYVAKTKQTLLSNAEGKVTFALNGVSNIQVTHSAYATIKLRSTLLKEKENVFYLKNTVNSLDEIIVTKKHPQKILSELVENSKKKLTVPAQLKVYSREFLKLDGNYAYYNDGLLNFQLYGKDAALKNDILIEQNRSYGIVDDRIREDALGYNLNDIMANYYSYKYLTPILGTDSKAKYDFVVKAYSSNADYNLMVVTPLDDQKGLLDDYTILYDRVKKLIVEVSTVVSPLTLANMQDRKTNGSKNIYKSSFKAIYRAEGTNYFLIGSKEEIGFEKVQRKKTTNIEVKNCFVVTNFNTKKFTYRDNEVFKDKTLYNKKNSILTNYWDISGLTSTTEEQKIIATLEYRE